MTVWKNRGGKSLGAAIEAAYKRGADDYHMPPLVALDEAGQPVGKVQDGDTVVFCCRRGEREIELTEMFTDKAFNAVERTWREDLTFVLLTNENSFSMTCEKVGANDGTVNHFAKADFQVFKKLFDFDFSEIESELEIDCFSTICNYRAIGKKERMYNNGKNR